MCPLKNPARLNDNTGKAVASIIARTVRKIIIDLHSNSTLCSHFGPSRLVNAVASDTRALSNVEEEMPPGCMGLPQGRTGHWSKTCPGRLFYHNAQINVSQWALPVTLRYFHVDVLQQNKRLGLRLEPGTDERARQ